MINHESMTDEELIRRIHTDFNPSTLVANLADRLAGALDLVEELEDESIMESYDSE